MNHAHNTILAFNTVSCKHTHTLHHHRPTLRSRYMSKHPPLESRVFEAMFVYNLYQIILNSWCFVAFMNETRLQGMAIWGNQHDKTPAGYRIGFLIWVRLLMALAHTHSTYSERAQRPERVSETARERRESERERGCYLDSESVQHVIAIGC